MAGARQTESCGRRPAQCGGGKSHHACSLRRAAAHGARVSLAERGDEGRNGVPGIGHKVVVRHMTNVLTDALNLQQEQLIPIYCGSGMVHSAVAATR